MATFSMKGKAYRYMETDASPNEGFEEWVQCGAGFLKVLKNRESEELHLEMRDLKTKRVAVRTPVPPNRMPVTKMDGSEKAVVWTCEDGVTHDVAVLALKCGSVEDADYFLGALEAAQAFMAGLKERQQAAASKKKKEKKKEKEKKKKNPP